MDNQVLEVQNLLQLGFLPDKAPCDRGFGKLAEIVEKMRQCLVGPHVREWSASPEPVDSEEDTFLQTEPFLALCTHLEWLCSVFQTVPGASLTIR
jgi:hypothetical protein